MFRRAIPGVILVGVACLAGCYYSPQTRRAKANPSFLGEAEAEDVIQRRLAPHGIKLVSNMKLQRDAVVFEADGYDRDLRVGYEYRSHEGMDFEGEEDSGADGLTDGEIEALRARQDTFREYFLIVPEGAQDTVDQAVEAFVKLLYEREVLKQSKKETKGDNLFPEEKKATGDALPWEATGDLKKKREEMEKREKERDVDEDSLPPDDDSWKGDEDGGGKPAEEKRPAAGAKKPKEEKKKPVEEKKKPADDGKDPFSDEDEDF